LFKARAEKSLWEEFAMNKAGPPVSPACSQLGAACHVFGERESRLIIDSIPGLVALLTASGHVDVVNPQVFEYFGKTLEELRRWQANDTVYPEDLPHVIDVLIRSVASGSPFDIVQRLRRSDGVYRWFQSRGFPIRDGNGQLDR
jgi:PAS domain S-box-containing protein